MPEENKDQQIKKLKVQVEKYQKEIEARDNVDLRNSQWRWWMAKKTGGIFLGWRLKKSINNLFTELKSGKVSSETLSDVTTHTLWRFTRIGLFAILMALIPVSILLVQTFILSSQDKKLESQNKLFEAQNKRIKQQTYLQEAERRSSLVFLFNNVLDKIDEELKAQNGKSDTLSGPLIGRIVSLSRALRPYQYLEGDSIIGTPISPERGQLLVSLAETKLDIKTVKKIFEKADFSYSDLKGANLRNANLILANLRFSDLSNAKLSGAQLGNANLMNANLKGATINGADFFGTILSNANLEEANLRFSDLLTANLSGSNLKDANLERTKLSEVNFMNADLRGADFTNSDLIQARLSNANLQGVDFSVANISEIFVEQLDWITSSGISAIPIIDSIYQVDTTMRIYNKRSPNPDTMYMLKRKH